ncbi:MAG: sigma-54-dependent Fis family transcriptional regulator [Verrucomicrobiales bacterium]|nr:sigma-54-dependent Fis family transcriptional regulator [Verrucomicrobiales bacterium]
MNPHQPTLLIVDDEKSTRDGLRLALEDRFDVLVAEEAGTAFEVLERERIDVLLTDLRLPKEDGLRLISRAKSLPKPPVCILMTAYGSDETIVEAMKRGADDYIAKGRMEIELLELKIEKALRSRNLEAENVALHRQLDVRFGLEHLVGDSPAFREVLETVRQVADSRATVLIRGESGTGKELIARAIHQLSPRSRGPLVTVHGGALAPTLLESELFGHEKGAFTGAHERRIGRFENAQGGTLFLDEIGEIDATLQVKLLRFLDQRTFERVGSSKTLTADVRFLTATHRDLQAMVRDGRFREDLYWRLCVVEIVLPPLRDRRSDIPLLASSFLADSATANGKSVAGFSPEAMDALQSHDWPGNVRELRAKVERAVILCRGDLISLRDLPTDLRRTGAGSGGVPATSSGSMSNSSSTAGSGVSGGGNAAVSGTATVQEAERQLIIQALRETGGNRTEAARRIGLSRRTLHRKLHEYQLEGF